MSLPVVSAVALALLPGVQGAVVDDIVLSSAVPEVWKVLVKDAKTIERSFVYRETNGVGVQKTWSSVRSVETDNYCQQYKGGFPNANYVPPPYCGTCEQDVEALLKVNRMLKNCGTTTSAICGCLKRMTTTLMEYTADTCPDSMSGTCDQETLVNVNQQWKDLGCQGEISCRDGGVSFDTSSGAVLKPSGFLLAILAVVTLLAQLTQ